MAGFYQILGMTPAVWSTQELGEEFDVLGFAAPYVIVQRKSDGVRGSLSFQHPPRFYFSFEPASA